MGLIKTAIMTGGGMYAANKIAKSIQQQNSTNNHNGSRDNSPPHQDNYNPRPADRDQRDNYVYDNDSRREYDPHRDYSARPPTKPSNSSGFSFPASEDDNHNGRFIQPAEYPYQPASYIAQRSDDPPTYSPHPQHAQPRPNVAQQGQQRPQYEDQQQMSGGNPVLREAAGMAMDFVRNGGHEGKKDKGKKGSDMFSELLK